MSKEEENTQGAEIPRLKRRAKRRRPDTRETDWESVRRDIWLRELLSSSTEEEDVQEAKRVRP
jgi:hypothetical protein